MITEDQFDAIDRQIQSACSSARKTPEAVARRGRWEAAIALPDRTAAQRAERYAAIAAVAAEL